MGADPSLVQHLVTVSMLLTTSRDRVDDGERRKSKLKLKLLGVYVCGSHLHLHVLKLIKDSGGSSRVAQFYKTKQGD